MARTKATGRRMHADFICTPEEKVKKRQSIRSK